MSIKDLLQKIKPFYPLLIILVIISIFFAVWRISVNLDSRTPIKIEYSNAEQTGSVIQAILGQPPVSSETNGSEAGVIGSKTGKKYYFPWCGTVKRIKPENQIKFASVKEARSAGFLPGGNCKGLN